MDIKELNNKKILLIIPHQDDEIHIAGSLLASLDNADNVYVLYTTNGDFLFDAKYRYRECIKSLEKLANIDEDKIIFMGYSDQAYDQKTHMYNTFNDWVSNKGYKETYAPYGFNEWNYLEYGKHCKYNRDNFCNNIKEIIEKYLPEVIICNDLDFHPDHLMTSLAFERALGLIIRNNPNYKPLVLKTFAYENSYFGKDDFFDNKDIPMLFNYDKFGNVISNPYYSKNNAISLAIDRKCYTKNLFKNKIFKAILCHKSQLLVKRTGRIINANIVYWKRNTNNLLLDANISVSSGNKEYLNDFMLADTSNVLNGNNKEIIYDKGIWIPDNDDNKKEIDINLDNKKYIYLIRIYSGRINNKFIKNLEIIYNDKKKEITLENSYINDIIIDEEINNLKIFIKDKEIFNGFSEIELVNYKEKFEILEKGNAINKKYNPMVGIINKFTIKILVILQKIRRKIFIR